MQAQKFKIPMPFKGVNRALGYESQPEGTCWDSLNIIPFDRQRRIRLSQRPGISVKQDLGTAAPIRLLHVINLAGGTSSGDITDVYSDGFNYSAGDLTGNGNWTTNGSDTSWVVQNPANPYNLYSPNTHAGNLNSTDLAAWAHDEIFQIEYDAFFITGANPALKYATIWVQDGSANIIWAIDARETAPGTADFTVTQPDGSTLQATGVTLSTSPGQYNVQMVLTVDPFAQHVSLTLNGSEILSGTAVPTPAGAWTIVFRGGQITTVASGGNVQIANVEFNEQPQPSISRARTKLLAVSGSDTFIGKNPGAMSEVANDGSFQIDSTSLFVSAASILGFSYIVDGTNLYRFDEENNVYDNTYAPTNPPSGCTIAVNYRGRLVLSGSDSDSQNIFASRVDDPTDWDYSQTDPAAAWAANAAQSGRVGAPVIALMPLSDDIMLIGCEQSVWRLEGDPTDGGAIQLVTTAAGLSGPNAWCKAEDGTVYTVGPTGMFQFDTQGLNPKPISRDVYPQFFLEIDRFTEHVTLVYDTEKHGIWIWITPEAEDSAPAVSMYYDVRQGGFWPQQLINIPQAGPLAAVQWDAIGADNRVLLLGGYDGVIYWPSNVGQSDVFVDGTRHAITSYVTLGPFSPTNPDNSIITSVDVAIGEKFIGSSGIEPVTLRLDWTLQGGRTAYSVTQGTPVNKSSGAILIAGARTIRNPRTRGSWLTCKLANNDVDSYFTVEEVTLGFVNGGKFR